ncbi:hypothetical protein DRO19_04755 [Candidatus Bathyarchaeota archaeon]|nr:MAG: hypothetical protein DRO19_04755 [Candidatus Bathyarchaeota archaeon]
MSEEDVEVYLQRLVAEGILKVENIDGEDYYSFTEKGLRETEEFIRKSKDAQLQLFAVTYNMLVKKRKPSIEALKESIKFLLKYNPNFMELLEKAIENGKIKKGESHE